MPGYFFILLSPKERPRRISRPHLPVPAETCARTTARWLTLLKGAVMLSRGLRASEICVEKMRKRVWRICNRILCRKERDHYGPSSFPWKRMTLALDQGKVCPHFKARSSLSHWLTVVMAPGAHWEELADPLMLSRTRLLQVYAVYFLGLECSFSSSPAICPFSWLHPIHISGINLNITSSKGLPWQLKS